MVRGCKAFLTALVLLAGCSVAFAQEATIGAGKIEIGGFPGGGTFFVSGDDNTEVNFNVYTAGGDITYYINSKAAADAPNWGFRVDYRMLFINSKSSAPAFFAQSKSRRAHRIYIGMLYTWKR